VPHPANTHRAPGGVEPTILSERSLDLRERGRVAVQPTFWSDALKAHLGGMLTEAEELSKELGYVN
jgi:hypothetical protein